MKTSVIHLKPETRWESSLGPAVIHEQRWDPFAEEWLLTIEYRNAGTTVYLADPAPGTGRRHGPLRSGPGLVKPPPDSLRLEHNRHYRHTDYTPGEGITYEIHCPDGRWRKFVRFTNHHNLFLPDDHPSGPSWLYGRTLAFDVSWLWDKFIGPAAMGCTAGDPRKETGAWGIGIYALAPSREDYPKLYSHPQDVDPSWAERLEELRLLPCYETAVIMEAERARIKKAVVESTPRDCWITRPPDGPTITVDDEEYMWITNMDDPFNPYIQQQWRKYEYQTDKAFQREVAASIQFQLLHFVGPTHGDQAREEAVGVYTKRGEAFLRTSGYDCTSSPFIGGDPEPFDVDLPLADDLERSKTLVRHL